MKQFFNIASELKTLRVLWLHKNGLAKLPDELRHFKGLWELHVHDEKLQTLPEWLTHLKKLRYIFTDITHFTHLPECTREPLMRAKRRVPMSLKPFDHNVFVARLNELLAKG